MESKPLNPTSIEALVQSIPGVLFQGPLWDKIQAVFDDAYVYDADRDAVMTLALGTALAEVGIGGQIAVRCGMEIGEVASPAAGDEDLLSRPVTMVDQQHPAAALAGNGGAHQAGAAGAEHDRVEARPVQDDVWLRRSSAFLSTS